jgi:pimeloyl-ACP methyl ester carboxylesterase
MPYFQSHSGKIYYEDVGKGNTIVFIHGWTLDFRMWQPQVDFFKSNYRCINIDLNGYGGSSIPKNNYDYSETLHELIEYLHLQKFSIIGLSMGAYICLNYAIKHQSGLSKLVLLSPTIPGVQFSEKFNAYLEEIYSAGMVGNLDQAKKLWLDSPIFATLKNNHPENFLLLSCMIKDYTGWDISSVAPTEVEAKNNLSDLVKLNVPTFVITGELDGSDFINNGQLLVKTLPQVKLESVKKSSHLVNLEFPNIVNKLIADFLESRL